MWQQQQQLQQQQQGQWLINFKPFHAAPNSRQQKRRRKPHLFHSKLIDAHVKPHARTHGHTHAHTDKERVVNLRIKVNNSHNSNNNTSSAAAAQHTKRATDNQSEAAYWLFKMRLTK